MKANHLSAKKISLNIFCISIFILLCFSEIIFAQRKEIIAYFPEWGARSGTYYVKNLETTGSAEKLSVINYAFALPVPDSAGNIIASINDPFTAYQQVYPAELSVDGTADDSLQPLRGLLNQFKKLKERHPHLKLVISFGGWSGSTYFSDAARTPQSREIFVNSCIDLFIKGNLPVENNAGGIGSAAGIFDGIDIDWEYPLSGGDDNIKHNENDRENLSELFALFRNRLDEIKPGYILSAAVPVGGEERFNFYNDQKYLDYFQLMTYDLRGGWDKKTGHHTNLFSSNINFYSDGIEPSLDRTVRKFLHVFGVSKDKIIPGAAFYSRIWKVNNLSNFGLREEGSPARGINGRFYNITKLKANGFRSYWDVKSMAPYLFNHQDSIFLSHDDEQSIALKSRYVDAYDLRGLMFWEISGDDSIGTLVNTIFTRSMHQGKKVNDDEVSASFNITHPAPDEILIEGSSIIIDTDIQSAAKAEFFADDISIGYDVNFPFNWSWFNVPEGHHTIKVEVSDSDGNVKASKVLPVYIHPSFR